MKKVGSWRLSVSSSPSDDLQIGMSYYVHTCPIGNRSALVQAMATESCDRATYTLLEKSCHTPTWGNNIDVDQILVLPVG